MLTIFFYYYLRVHTKLQSYMLLHISPEFNIYYLADHSDCTCDVAMCSSTIICDYIYSISIDFAKLYYILL